MISNGAGANAPGEKLGFYFGGLKKQDASIIQNIDPDNQNTTIPSNDLIVVDLAERKHATWTPNPLPEYIRTRAEAGLAWIPAGENGMLVAIGGAFEPTDHYVDGANSSKEASNDFTTEISIYDIKHNRWFTQNVSETDARPPGRLAQFCVVVASNFNDSMTHRTSTSVCLDADTYMSYR